MSDRNQREWSILAQRFIDYWQNLNPDIPVKWENRNFSEPTSATWVAFSVNSGAVIDAAIGGFMARGLGFVTLQIFFVENSGTMAVRKLADDFADCFAQYNVAYTDSPRHEAGSIWARRPTLNKLPIRDGWNQWNVTIDFQHDQLVTT